MSDQTTTINFFGGPLLRDSFAASVVSVEPTGTILALSCPTPFDETELGGLCLDEVITITAGPSTFALSHANSVETLAYDCAIEPEQGAECTLAFDSMGSPNVGVQLWDWEQVKLIENPVTITEGVEKIIAGPTAAGVAREGEATATATGAGIEMYTPLYKGLAGTVLPGIVTAFAFVGALGLALAL